MRGHVAEPELDWFDGAIVDRVERNATRTFVLAAIWANTPGDSPDGFVPCGITVSAAGFQARLVWPPADWRHGSHVASVLESDWNVEIVRSDSDSESTRERVEAVLNLAVVPSDLRVHLETVAATADALCTSLRGSLPFDEEAVLFGAWTHDIGKALVPEELFQPGKRHEAIGENFLLEHGVPAELARFARTHGMEPDEPSLQLEDLLVMLADKLWKQKRVAELEARVVRHVAANGDLEEWEVFVLLDDIAAASAGVS